MANSPMTDNDIVAVVQAAVAAERERCAKIAEAHGEKFTWDKDVAFAIARNIRNKD